MIISRQKDFRDILELLKEDNIFIIGCGKCAKKQNLGGEQQVREMKRNLELSGKNTTGWTVLSSACSITSWTDVLSQNPAINNSDALLVMSCGSGVSVISGFAGVQVYPALDTESLGGVCCSEIIADQCGLCGDCTVWVYGGICPVARCPKGLLNGPCGGESEGKCEVEERSCAWAMIFERLRETGKLENLDEVQQPKDHMKKIRGRN